MAKKDAIVTAYIRKLENCISYLNQELQNAREDAAREIIEYIKTLPMGFTENGKGGYNRRFYISDEKLKEFAKQHGVEVKE